MSNSEDNSSHSDSKWIESHEAKLPDKLPGSHIPEEEYEKTLDISSSDTAEILPQEDVADGDTLGRYELREVLGKGGFGAVYLGYDTLLNRSVAVKVPLLKPAGEGTFSNTQAVQQEFLKEARQLAQLTHPGIVSVYDVGVHEGRCFIVSDFLDGKNLKQWTHDHKPAWPQVLAILAAVADALAHAHSRSTVHRDIKPENILMAERAEGLQPVLVDFGLAISDSVAGASERGHVSGTPRFMSPEQVRGEAHCIDGRTDIYSLGVVMYQLLCDRPPFRSGDVRELLRQIVEDDPVPLRRLVHGLPLEVERICRKAMAKDVDDRYTTAADMAAEIRGVLKKHQEQAKSAAAVKPKGKSSKAARRQVTVLTCKCDLLESAEFMECFDPEGQHEILSDHQQACKDIIARWDGTIVQLNETEMMVCFGYPIAYEDAARRAVNTGLGIMRETCRLQELLANSDVTFTYSIGIHTGLAVLQESSGEGESLSMVGEARNVAAKLENVAPDDSLVITESTNRLTRGFYVCQSLGKQRIKGLSSAIEIFQVTGETQAKSRMDIAQASGLTPLVGRESELAMLLDLWEQVEEGEEQVVCIIGEAGLGKSRLVHEIKERAAAEYDGERQPIVEWRSSPFYQNTSFYPAVDYFERTLGIGRGDAADEKLNKLAAHLGEYALGDDQSVALFAALLSIPLGDRYPSLELTPMRQMEKTQQTLLAWIRGYARKQPVLFIVEDLHWTDPTTLQLLTQIVDQRLGERAMIVLTFRPEFETPWGSRANQTHVALNRLTHKQTEEMMRRQAKLGDIPRDVVEQVIDRTEGVPLFVEEFTHMIVESGALQEVGGKVCLSDSFRLDQIPATLQDLLISRLDRMDSEREVVQMAAALGREFAYELILAASQQDELALQVELEKLVKAELIFQEGSPPRAIYMFKHALIQDAAYDSLLKKRRLEFHAHIGNVLAEKFPELIESAPELLAQHFTKAEEPAQAVPYWLKAGLRAQSQSAVLEAIDHFSRGLQCLGLLDESVHRHQQELQFQLPLGNVLIQAKGYAAAEVANAFQRAYELCQRIGAGAPLFHVALGMWKFTLVNSEFDKCRQWADKLLELAAPQTDPGIHMEAYFPTCCTLFYVGRFAESVEYGEKGFALYDDERCKFHSQFTGQNAGVGTPAYGALALWALGYPDRALKWSREGVALGKGIKDPFSLAFGLYHLGWLAYYCGNWEEVKECGEIGRAFAEELNFVFFEALAIINQGAALLCKEAATADELLQGVEQLRQGLAAYMGTGASLHIAHPYIMLADGLLRAGRYDEAQAELDNGSQHVERSGELFARAEMHRLEGELLLARSTGNRDAAAACFRQAIEAARQQQSKSWELRAATSLARLQYAGGQQDQARTTLAAAYHALDEGLETRDLVVARALLQQWS